MRLLALLYWKTVAAYLSAVLRRIAVKAPLHPERTRTEWELAEAQRRIRHIERSLSWTS